MYLCVAHENSSRGLIPLFAKNKEIGLLREAFGRNFLKTYFHIIFMKVMSVFSLFVYHYS